MRWLKKLFKGLYTLTLGLLGVLVALATLIGVVWLLKPYANFIYKVEMFFFVVMFGVTTWLMGAQLFDWLHSKDTDDS